MKYLKKQLRGIVRQMKSWRYVGWLVRICIAVVRLPDYDAVRIFQNEQLPTMLETISDLNHRQLLVDNDKENLIKSIPVTLRTIKRDIVEIRKCLEECRNTSEKGVSGKFDDVGNKLSAIENQIADIV